jgi:Initiator Replication protein
MPSTFRPMATSKRSKKHTAASQQIGLFQIAEVPNTFRKAVQIVHSEPKAPMSMLQRKLSNVWLKNAVETEPDKDGWWSISVSQMNEHIGFDSKNQKYLHDSAHELMTIVFEWDVIAPARKKTLWKASVLFPEVEIESGVIRYQISGQLKERVLNPDLFALIDMNILRKLRRGPSIALYEFCVRFVKVNFTTPVEWEKLRDMIMGASSESASYEEYKYFRAKILKPCLAEINSQTELQIELLEPVKKGRKIHTLQFSVHVKHDDAIDVELPDEDTLEVVGEIIKIGVLQSEAKKLTKQYSLEAIKAAIAYTKANAKSNPPAFFRGALEKGWAQAEDVSIKASKPAKAPATTNNAATQLEDAFAAQRRVEAAEYFKELNPAECEELVDKYNGDQSTKALMVNLHGRTGQGALSKFYTWLANETWGAVTPDLLLDFARKEFMKKPA